MLAAAILLESGSGADHAGTHRGITAAAAGDGFPEQNRRAAEALPLSST